MLRKFSALIFKDTEITSALDCTQGDSGSLGSGEGTFQGLLAKIIIALTSKAPNLNTYFVEISRSFTPSRLETSDSKFEKVE